MSPRLPRVTAVQLLRALHRDGWIDEHQTGSHRYLRHGVKPGRVTVPIHRGMILKPATLASILEEAGLDAEALRRLL